MNNGFTIWLTGLSGSGKSTLSKEIYKYITEKGLKAQIIDGDTIRGILGNLFGYCNEDRIKMARVYRLVCKLLNDNGIIAITAAIAPFKEIRDENRAKIEKYIEIYLDCPIEKCIERDVKGLYARAIRGEEKQVIGIDENYEVPTRYDIKVNTAEKSIEECMEEIKEYLNINILK